MHRISRRTFYHARYELGVIDPRPATDRGVKEGTMPRRMARLLLDHQELLEFIQGRARIVGMPEAFDPVKQREACPSSTSRSSAFVRSG